MPAVALAVVLQVGAAVVGQTTSGSAKVIDDLRVYEPGHGSVVGGVEHLLGEPDDVGFRDLLQVRPFVLRWCARRCVRVPGFGDSVRPDRS